MTIKWVKSDPLVMNGEPFCYGSRMTVRQLLEERRSGYTLIRILTDHPELRPLGIATAWAFAADHSERYSEFIEPDGSLSGPGFTDAEAEILPEALRRPGVVIKGEPAAAWSGASPGHRTGLSRPR